MELCEDSLSFYPGNLQTCLEAALGQQRVGLYGKGPYSLRDFSFKLFIVKTIDVDRLRGQEIIPSEARDAPRSLSPLSLQTAREVKSWCPNGHHTIA